MLLPGGLLDALLFLSALRLFMAALLSDLLLPVLVLPLLLLSVLLLLVLLLTLLLLGVLLLLGMLLFGPGLLVLCGLRLLRVVLFFALLLCVHRSNDSEK